MSKKQAKSDREIDLPDWADDVTPADEVMRKFYAPTGAFQRGPIPISGAETQITNEPDAARASRTEGETARTALSQDEASATSAAAAVSTQFHKAEQIEETPVSQISQSQIPEPSKDFETSLLSPVAERQTPLRVNPTVESTPPLPKSVQGAEKSIASASQTVSFEEFAKRWRRYLYPGQLSVMRALFEQTLMRGTSECFTRYSELAASTKMTRRNCINVMNSLVERGFVERLEVRNDAIDKGIKLRIHPDPLL